MSASGARVRRAAARTSHAEGSSATAYATAMRMWLTGAWRPMARCMSANAGITAAYARHGAAREAPHASTVHGTMASAASHHARSTHRHA